VNNNQFSSDVHTAPVIALAASQGLADRRDLAVIALERTRMPMVVTDPRLPDNPIVLANQAFLDLCGYEADEVVGRNCRFLQGPDTDPGAVAKLRPAINEAREVEVELLNYRKDGSTFWNKVFVSPIHDDAGELIYFFASQKDETAKQRAIHLEAVERKLLREVDHRTKNALALVQSIVLLSQRADINSFATSIEGRVGSIVKSHVLLADHNWGDVPIKRMFESESLDMSDGLVTLVGPDTVVPAPLVQPLALIIHEIFDNAVKHGAMSVRTGRVQVSWTCNGSNTGVDIIIGESGGPVPPEHRPRGLGSRLIERIVAQQLGGKAQFDFGHTGLQTTLSIPVCN
jgi:PAS domain S-box-containing protein